jgi:hypothetical protein
VHRNLNNILARKRVRRTKHRGNRLVKHFAVAVINIAKVRRVRVNVGKTFAVPQLVNHSNGVHTRHASHGYAANSGRG